VPLGKAGTSQFNIDLVLYDVETERARCVMETKYQPSPVPAAEDIAQVVAYAVAKGCYEAILVYPSSHIELLDENVGDIRIRSLTFPLDGDLEHAGGVLLQNLLGDGF